VRVVLVVIAIWFAVAFLLGPLVGRVLKFGHIRPTGGPPAPEPDPEEDEEEEPEPEAEEGATRED
jgi:hypothetical protein